LLLSVVIEQFSANRPSAPHEMLPTQVTRIDPPLLKTGPVLGVEIVCVDGVQTAHAAPGSPSAASAASEAPASSADRQSRPGLELDAMDCENSDVRTLRAAEAREFIPESPVQDAPQFPLYDGSDISQVFVFSMTLARPILADWTALRRRAVRCGCPDFAAFVFEKQRRPIGGGQPCFTRAVFS
jgi:hypothetical protein